MENNAKNTEFLQSEEWREFHAKAGSRVFCVENEGFSASIIEHQLPIVGRYFYVPRGQNVKTSKCQNVKFFFSDLINLAKKEESGWIRIDLENENSLNLIKKNIDCKIVKAPHDMQPREIFVIDINKNSEELLGEMSQKTRYNIRLAEKRGVKVFAIINNQDAKSKQISNSNDQISKKYIDKFIDLVNLTAKRKGISFHAEDYYRKMFENLPENMLKLYVAEYNGKVIAANMVVFYGDTATYLHGATDDKYRNVMAPYLLQWQAISDAKKVGYKKYDFGGVKTSNVKTSKQQTSNNWQGITRFKLGFSPNTRPVEFLGSYDIIVNPRVYLLYQVLQKIKELFIKIRK